MKCFEQLWIKDSRALIVERRRFSSKPIHLEILMQIETHKTYTRVVYLRFSSVILEYLEPHC